MLYLMNVKGAAGGLYGSYAIIYSVDGVEMKSIRIPDNKSSLRLVKNAALYRGI